MSNQLSSQETKSCFNCSHAEVWTDQDVAGFDCTHPISEDKDWVEPEDYVTMTYAEFALYCARTCKDYKRIRSNAQAQS